MGRVLSYTPEQAQAWVAAYQVIRNLQVVAKQFGFSPMTVRKALLGCGVDTSKIVKDHTGLEVGGRRIIGFYKRCKNGVSFWYYECLKCGKKGTSSVGNLKNRKCALSGREIVIDKKWGPLRRIQTASLDRIDSNLGYIEGNVWWIHKDFQWMKNDFTVAEFVGACKEVVEYQARKS